MDIKSTVVELWRCNPELNVNCPKRGCQEECQHTTDVRFAVLDENAHPIPGLCQIFVEKEREFWLTRFTRAVTSRLKSVFIGLLFTLSCVGIIWLIVVILRGISYLLFQT